MALPAAMILPRGVGPIQAKWRAQGAATRGRGVSGDGARRSRGRSGGGIGGWPSLIRTSAAQHDPAPCGPVWSGYRPCSWNSDFSGPALGCVAVALAPRVQGANPLREGPPDPRRGVGVAQLPPENWPAEPLPGGREDASSGRRGARVKLCGRRRRRGWAAGSLAIRAPPARPPPPANANVARPERRRSAAARAHCRLARLPDRFRLVMGDLGLEQPSDREKARSLAELVDLLPSVPGGVPDAGQLLCTYPGDGKRPASCPSSAASVRLECERRPLAQDRELLAGD